MAPRKVTHPVTVPHSLCFINNNKPATAKVKFKRPWRYRGSKTKPKSSRNMFNSFWYPHVPEGPLVYHCFCRVSKFCRKCRALNCWCCVFRNLLDEVQNEVILRQRQVDLQRGILEALKPVLQSPRYTRSTAKKHHRKFANSIRELQAHDLLDQEMFQEAEEIFEKLKQDRFALNKVQDFVLAFDTAPTLVELCLKSILHNPFMFPRYPGCFDRPSLLFSKNHNLLTDIKGSLYQTILEFPRDFQAEYKRKCYEISIGLPHFFGMNYLLPDRRSTPTVMRSLKQMLKSDPTPEYKTLGPLLCIE